MDRQRERRRNIQIRIDFQIKKYHTNKFSAITKHLENYIPDAFYFY